MNCGEILLRLIYPKIHGHVLAVLYEVDMLSRTLMICSVLGVVEIGLANESASSGSRRKL